METYCKFFDTKDGARELMVTKNRVNREKYAIYCLVDGPEDNFAVVDIHTAIDLGIGYEWSTR